MPSDISQDNEIPGICIRCFGRAFAKEGTGISNLERGETFLQEYEKTLLNSGYVITEEKSCRLCHGLFSRFELYFDALQDELGKYEYSNFLIGSTFPEETIREEESLQRSLGNRGEPIKREFNREFGKFVSEMTSRNAEFNEPEITVIVDLNYDSFKIKPRSLFVYGIYNKRRRDIPQTRWIHKKDVTESIESIIGDRLKTLTGGKNYYLHGAGREDVDVQMLGNGREFIIEASEPERRFISLEELQEMVNSSGEGIEIGNLRFSSRNEVSALKGNSPDKSYLVRVKGQSPIDRDRMVDAAEKLTGKHIYQRTPLRVSTRRSDLVRDKQVREATVDNVDGDVAVIRIRAEAGTYIKELVHGDEGRTKPSLSETYGEPLGVDSLDVIWIHRNGE